MAQDDDDHCLNDNWTLYFHEPSDSNWNMPSYNRLNQISTVESFWQVHEGTKKYLRRGMFFLMREHVFPCWDDPSNQQGGCISIKVLKDELEAFWEAMAVRMLGEQLAVDGERWSSVLGISTSPKRFFCICKIWLAEGGPTEREAFNLPPRYHGEPLYRSNADNIQHNSARSAP